MRCPICDKEYEPCALCRQDVRHQQCVDDGVCPDCQIEIAEAFRRSEAAIKHYREARKIDSEMLNKPMDI
jgi:hypothetical protein